ncbi:MAG: chemotaxis protein CheD [Elusimicrobiota bacterium]
MKSKTVNVPTGTVKVLKGSYVLRAYALGSCIGVAACSSKEKIGGLAHVMLPGKAPDKKDVTTNRYAINALENLFSRMEKLGVDKNLIRVCMAGAGNVLKKKNDVICKKNILSITEELKKYNLRTIFKFTGGTQRWGLSLNTVTGRAVVSNGNTSDKYVVIL